MTYANVGLIEATPGNRDALVEILTRPNGDLAAVGCLLYDVGVNDDDPEAVFATELWESAEAHAASLQLGSVQAAIADARPILSGRMEGMRFEVLGSPLRE
ncbi:antibiotic biosynthesis monooxygenase [Kocuria polaris]|nr:antibiotic biosynthesis monooxygenase [Kocuria polaris]